jgi:uncharacterized protein YjbI with pentapeptide repeats
MNKAIKSENSSLYYLLATVYGEQDKRSSFNGEHEEKNRRIWHAIVGQWINEKSIESFASSMGLDVREFEPLDASEIEDIKKRLSGTPFSKGDIPGKEDAHAFFGMDFRNIIFEKPILMKKRLFPTTVTFVNCTFLEKCSFSESYFKSAHFINCIFDDYAFFQGARFGNFGFVSNACEFKNCTFNGHVDYSNCQLRNADFSNSAFKTSAHFEDAYFFLGCPKFFEAELPENTIFPLKSDHWGLPFPNVDRQGNPQEYSESEIHRESIKFAVLRKRMEAIQRPVEANFFMRKELSLRSKLKGWDALLIKLYGLLSGYGHSVSRPFILLLTTIFFGAAVYSGYFATPLTTPIETDSPLTTGLGLSLSATFNFLGLGRLFFDEILKELPSALAFIYGLQTLSGFLFSFLLGLGVRSQLRLK